MIYKYKLAISIHRLVVSEDKSGHITQVVFSSRRPLQGKQGEGDLHPNLPVSATTLLSYLYFGEQGCFAQRYQFEDDTTLVIDQEV